MNVKSSPIIKSLIQRLLPPIASIISSRIHHLTNPRNIQILHRSILPIDREERDARLVGLPSRREVRDILLQRNGNLIVQHSWVRAVEVRIRYILSVNRRRDREVVCVCFVSVGFVEVEGIAGEDTTRGVNKFIIGEVVALIRTVQK